MNLLIKNETYTLGVNPERKFYTTLKLGLHDFENINAAYTLEFNIKNIKWINKITHRQQRVSKLD